MKRLVLVLCLVASPAVGEEWVTFNADGTWTPPSGVTEITIHCRGAGGNGGGPDMTSLGSGGGGGGAYARTTMTVSAVSYSITAGAGKHARFGYGVTDYCLAAKGADGVVGVTGAAGGQASASVGDVRYSGGAGADAPGNAGGGGGSSAGISEDGNNGSGSTGGVAPNGGYPGGGGGAEGQPGGNANVGAGGGGTGGGGPSGGLGGTAQVMISWGAAAPPPPDPDPETQVATPVPTVPSGEFCDPFSVNLTTTTVGAVIRYTLDGSAPSTTSPAWQGPMTISEGTVLRARAYKSGLTASDPIVVTYTKNCDQEPCVAADAAGGFGVWRCPDADGDGLPDAIEELHAAENHAAVDPAVAGGLTDADGDGAPDFWEVLRWYKCWIPHVTTCHCTQAEVYEYLSLFNGSGSIVPSVTRILAAKSDGYAYYDADNDGVWDGCPAGSGGGGGSHTGHCCNCCCSACQAADLESQKSLWGEIAEEDDVDTDGDGCPDWKDPEPNNSQIGCEERPDDWKAWLQSRLNFGSTGIDSQLPQTGHVLPLQLDVPGLGLTTFYLASMPNTATPLGAAIDGFRLLCRGLAIVAGAIFFSYKTFQVLRQY